GHISNSNEIVLLLKEAPLSFGTYPEGVSRFHGYCSIPWYCLIRRYRVMNIPMWKKMSANGSEFHRSCSCPKSSLRGKANERHEHELFPVFVTWGFHMLIAQG